MGRLGASEERKHVQAVAMAVKRVLLRRHFLAQQLMVWVVVPMTLMESPVVHLVFLKLKNQRVSLAASVVLMQPCFW